MMPSTGLAPEREANDENDSREEAAEEGREGSEETHASFHPSALSWPSSSYSSSSSSFSFSSSSSSSLAPTGCSSSAASSSCSSCSPSFSLPRPAWPVVPESLEEGHSEVSSRPFVAAPPVSCPLPVSLCLADSPSEPGLRTPRHANGSLVPVSEVCCCPFLHLSSFLSTSFSNGLLLTIRGLSYLRSLPRSLPPFLSYQPTGFRRMPRDPVTGRRICYYFNHTGCAAGAQCAYTHVKVRAGGSEGRKEGRNEGVIEAFCSPSGFRAQLQTLLSLSPPLPLYLDGPFPHHSRHVP